MVNTHGIHPVVNNYGKHPPNSPISHIVSTHGVNISTSSSSAPTKGLFPLLSVKWTQRPESRLFLNILIRKENFNKIKKFC
jgi:hypothetical protein